MNTQTNQLHYLSICKISGIIEYDEPFTKEDARSKKGYGYKIIFFDNDKDFFNCAFSAKQKYTFFDFLVCNCVSEKIYKLIKSKEEINYAN